MDALQIVVRDFAATDRIADYLKEIGFGIKWCADSDADTNGGLIETTIIPVIELEIDDGAKIAAHIYRIAGCPCRVYVNTWSCAEALIPQ